MAETAHVDARAHVEARLNSLFELGFVAEGRVLIDAMGQTPTPGVLPDPVPAKIRDARELQFAAAAGKSFSEAGFFAEHSFVLLDHRSDFRDWDADPAGATDAGLTRIYFPEIESIIRERLLPGHTLEIPPVANLLRRGPDSPNPFYGTGVHQDFGLSADDYQENVAAYGTDEAAGAWRCQYDRDEVAGFLVVNFWRTVHSDEPLRHLPLAVCDPYSVKAADVVSTGLLNFTPTGRPSNQLGLRHNPEQCWYYYPAMTAGEVLAFKNFQCFKDDARPTLRTCFHSAFEEPGAPADARPRQSCEYRVGVFILNE